MVEYVYARHDFIPEHEDEVAFRAGERIEVVEKDDLFNDGWWQVRYPPIVRLARRSRSIVASLEHGYSIPFPNLFVLMVLSRLGVCTVCCNLFLFLSHAAPLISTFYFIRPDVVGLVGPIIDSPSPSPP